MTVTAEPSLSTSAPRPANAPHPRRPADTGAAQVRWTVKTGGALLAAITGGPGDGRMLALVYRRRGQLLRPGQGATLDPRVPRTGWYLLDGSPPARWLAADEDRARARVELEFAAGWSRAEGEHNPSGDPLYERDGQRASMRTLIDQHLALAAHTAPSPLRRTRRVVTDG